jgi:hypothetical protein
MGEEVAKVDIYESEIIRRRLAPMLDGQSIEEFVGPNYEKDVKECLDILDIGYTVTAVGILGRALELCTKEYCESKIKRKTAFEKNTANVSISSIRKKFWGSSSTQAERLKLLNKQEVNKNRNTYKLKKPLLKDEYFHTLENIRNARNDAFHGCSDDEYRELSAKSGYFIEHGIVILVKLIKDISEV